MRYPKLGSFLLSCSLLLLALAIFGGRIGFWAPSGDIGPGVSRSSQVGLAIILGVVGIVSSAGNLKLLRLSPPVFASGLLLVFVSDWLVRGYNFFQGPSIRGELLFGTVVSGIALSRGKLGWLRWLGVISSIFLFLCFLTTADGRLIFADDQSVFFYRLVLLKERFPFIPFFNPLWNAGIDARDFFASGSLSIFFLASPLLAFFDVEQSYTFIVGLLLFGVVPACTYSAAKLENLPSPVPSIAATLSLTTGLVWYRWGLKYGTLGFITSSALLPFVLVLACRVIDEDRPLSRRESVVTSIVTSIFLLWSLAVVSLVPVGLRGMGSARKLLQKRYFLFFLVLLFVLNAPWMGLFVQVSKVGSFVQSETPSSEGTSSRAFRHRDEGPSIEATLRVISESAISTNPLLLFLGTPGLFLLPRRHRSVWLGTCAWLFLVGSVLMPVKPQLELDRMLVMLSLLLSIPTALCIHYLISPSLDPKRSRWRLAPAAISLGYLVTAPFAAAAVVSNRSVEQYGFASPIVREMAEAIRSLPGDGRVLFTGCVLHELSGGHLAPLPLWSGRALMASSFVHNIWRYQQLIPKNYLEQGDPGIEEYLNLFNVSHVMAHEPEWRDYFFRRTDKYRPVWRSAPFVMFERVGFASNYFHQGEGEAFQQSLHQVRFSPRSPDVVLKLNYFPFLKSSGCDLEPFKVTDSVILVRLTGCPVGQPVTIESRSALWRILNG